MTSSSKLIVCEWVSLLHPSNYREDELLKISFLLLQNWNIKIFREINYVFDFCRTTRRNIKKCVAAVFKYLEIKVNIEGVA